MANILIVDDEADIRGLLSDILLDEGHQIFQAGNAGSAIKMFEQEKVDLVILDIWLEGSEFDGLGVLKKIKNLKNDVPVIMISGHGNIETAVQTIKSGAYDFIEKPFKSEKLMIMIDRALAAAQLTQENKELKENLANFEFIGESKSINALKEAAKTAAPSKSRILISGESGVGKEALARYIHQLSPRKERPFVKLVCSSLKPDNFESEMFGSSNSQGVLDKANGGTLFLDEVGQLDYSCQGRLLKLIQESSYSKNGKIINFDIRVISSSSEDLNQLIEEGKFNQSLLFRINVLPLNIAPLRERRADIKPLCNLFIKFFAKNLSLPVMTLSDEVLTHLGLHQWPGNVRQLKNLIEWLMIMYGKSDSSITVDMLPNDMFSKSDNDNHEAEGVAINPDIISKPLKVARDMFERDYLKAQLSRFSGNISETAKFVGMERTALHRKIKLLNVENK